MSILKISLPISLQEFVDQRVRTEGYESDGDYVCDLSRKDRGRQQLRGLLLDGMRSAPKGCGRSRLLQGAEKPIQRMIGRKVCLEAWPNKIAAKPDHDS